MNGENVLYGLAWFLGVIWLFSVAYFIWCRRKQSELERGWRKHDRELKEAKPADGKVIMINGEEPRR